MVHFYERWEFGEESYFSCIVIMCRGDFYIEGEVIRAKCKWGNRSPYFVKKMWDVCAAKYGEYFFMEWCNI